MSRYPVLIDERSRVAVAVHMNDTPLPLFADKDGVVYVGGNAGTTYNLRIANISEERVEAIVGIDGKDVIGGLRVLPTTKGMVIPTEMTWKCLGWHATREVCRRFTFPAVDADMDRVQITCYGEGSEMLTLPQGSTHALPRVGGVSTGRKCGVTKFTRLAKFGLELRIADAQQLVGMDLSQL